MTPTFRVLTVCTMNICRSPAMEAAIIDSIAGCSTEDLIIEVSSAGMKATPGSPNCEISLAYVGHSEWHSTSKQLSSEDLARADLVLVAQSSHLAAVGAFPHPAPHTFTARAAARCAGRAATVLEEMEEPVAHLDRLRAWVAVMAALDGERLPEATRLPYGPNDVPDPHVLGINLHSTSAEMIKESVNALAQGARRVLGSF